MGAIAIVVLIAGTYVARHKIERAAALYEKGGWHSIYERLFEPAEIQVPNVVWESIADKSIGIDSERLARLDQKLASVGTDLYLIARDGYLLHEYYRSPVGPNTRWGTSAVGKAITAGMLVLAELSDDQIGIDDKLSKFIPYWRDEPVKGEISVRHIVTHSSGLEDVSFAPESLTGWKKRYYENRDERFLMAVNTAPTSFAPGSEMSYCGLGFYALAYALGANLKISDRPPIAETLRDRIMRPLEIPDAAWSISYSATHEVDEMQLSAIGSGGAYTGRAILRLGQLLLDRGNFNGRQLLDGDWIDTMLTPGTLRPVQSPPDSHPMGTGLAMWSNCDGFWPELPADAAVSLGGGPSILLVVPSLNLVFVRLGKAIPTPEPGKPYWKSLSPHIFGPLATALELERPAAANCPLPE